MLFFGFPIRGMRVDEKASFCKEIRRYYCYNGCVKETCFRKELLPVNTKESKPHGKSERRTHGKSERRIHGKSERRRHQKFCIPKHGDTRRNKTKKSQML